MRTRVRDDAVKLLIGHNVAIIPEPLKNPKKPSISRLLQIFRSSNAAERTYNGSGFVVKRPIVRDRDVGDQMNRKFVERNARLNARFFDHFAR